MVYQCYDGLKAMIDVDVEGASSNEHGSSIDDVRTPDNYGPGIARFSK